MATTTKKSASKEAASKAAKPKARSTKPAAASKSKEAAAKKPAAKAPKKAAAAAPTKPTTKAAPKARKAKPVVVDAPVPVVVGPAMRKKEIIEAVVTRSGAKKRDVKPVLESLLSVMADAIDEGREMVVPPFGRIKLHRQKKTAKKTVYFTKVHRNAPPAATPAKADGADEG